MAKYESLQEVFNVSYAGLAKQNFRQSLRSTGCAYRGLSEGSACAIGHCIPDELYSSFMEGQTLGTLACNHADVYLKLFGDLDKRALRELQKAHDRNEFPNDMKNELHRFAESHNLTIPEVETAHG